MGDGVRERSRGTVQVDRLTVPPSRLLQHHGVAFLVERSRKMSERIEISRASYEYLFGETMQEHFCDGCSCRSIVPGTHDSPPESTCPCDFEYGSENCIKRFVFADLVQILAEADERAGLEKNDFLEIEND
jgi:hypothetical protein